METKEEKEKKATTDGGKAKPLAKIVALYDEKNNKKPIPTGAKSLLDGVAIAAGTGVGAVSGNWGWIPGALLIIGGHFLGDKTGLSRIAGAAAITYTVAKFIQNKAAADSNTVNGVSQGSMTDGVKARLSALKDDWLHATKLNKLFTKKEEPQSSEPEESLGALDFSEMNHHGKMIQEAAAKYELQNSGLRAEELEGLNYAIIDEQLDISTM